MNSRCPIISKCFSREQRHHTNKNEEGRRERSKEGREGERKERDRQTERQSECIMEISKNHKSTNKVVITSN